MFRAASIFGVVVIGSIAMAAGTTTTTSNSTGMVYGVDATGQPVQVLGRSNTTKTTTINTSESKDVTKSPVAKKVKTESLAQRELNSVFFANDKATLSTDAKASLSKAAAWLKANPNAKVTIEAEADHPGTPQHNMALSKQRAATVRGYLKGLGVNSARLSTKALGEKDQRKASILVN